MSKRIISSLSHIDVETQDPLKLFARWKNEAASCKIANVMSLATSTKNGKVSNRNVVLQELTDGFIFLTKKNGRKIRDLLDNPLAAATFLFHYDLETTSVMRQVRIEGTVTELEKSICEKYFRNQPISGQIRSVICKQGEEVNWQELKRRHDELLFKLENKNTLLEMPEDESAFKIVPDRFDFYHSVDGGIADRVVFSKIGDCEWKYVHVAA